MQNERSHDPELARLEEQLAALVPTANIRREQFMFEAGARAARRKLVIANRLLAAACVLLAVTTVAPLAVRGRNGEVGHDGQYAAEKVDVLASETKVSEAEVIEAHGLPSHLVVADSRELAAALAAGRNDLRPARLRDVEHQDPARNFTDEADSAQPKSSRRLLREYLEAGGDQL